MMAASFRLIPARSNENIAMPDFPEKLLSMAEKAAA